MSTTLRVTPDGYLEFSLKKWSWDCPPAEKGPYKLRIEFQDISWWRIEAGGITIRYATEPMSFMLVPWWNITCFEWQCNSREVADAIRLERLSDGGQDPVQDGAGASVLEEHGKVDDTDWTTWP